jgi:ribosomal-protein-alanine N-acetyltransferase
MKRPRGRAGKRPGRKLHRLTKRLEIRPLGVKDYANWRDSALKMGPRQNRWDLELKPRALTRAKFDRLLRRQADERRIDNFYDFGVFRRDTGELVGKVALMNVVRGLGQQAFLGYRMWNPHWGNGFAAEASKAAMDIAFRDLGLHRIEAGIEPGNARSVRVARKLGLKREGIRKKAVYLRGKWRNLLAYVAFSEDYGVSGTPPKRGPGP